MTVTELLARTSSRELSEWLAYERIAGPLGPARGDIQAGIIAATIANANRGKGKPVLTADKFIPRWDRGEQQSPDEIYNQVAAFNRLAGGTVTTDSGV